MGFTSNLSFIRKNPITTAVALMTVTAGVAWAVRGGTGTTTYIDCATEFVTCTATGGLAKYAYCNWQEPVDDSGSGTTIREIYWSIGKAPASFTVDWTIGSSATVSGSVALTNLTDVSASTGVTVRYSTGATFLSSGNYLRGVTLTNPTSAHTATVMVDYCTRLSK